MLSRAEMASLIRLQGDELPIRNEVLDTLLLDPGYATRFVGNRDAIMTALVGVSPRLRDSTAARIAALAKTSPSDPAVTNAIIEAMRWLDRTDQLQKSWLLGRLELAQREDMAAVLAALRHRPDLLETDKRRISAVLVGLLDSLPKGDESSDVIARFSAERTLLGTGSRSRFLLPLSPPQEKRILNYAAPIWTEHPKTTLRNRNLAEMMSYFNFSPKTSATIKDNVRAIMFGPTKKSLSFLEQGVRMDWSIFFTPAECSNLLSRLISEIDKNSNLTFLTPLIEASGTQTPPLLRSQIMRLFTDINHAGDVSELPDWLTPAEKD